MKTQINVLIRTVPHPNPDRLIEMWARIVLKELLRREAEEGDNP